VGWHFVGIRREARRVGHLVACGGEVGGGGKRVLGLVLNNWLVLHLDHVHLLLH
jgi:hypothetical protein